MWISRIARAKTPRKVRIGAIFACKVLLEAIFGSVLGGRGGEKWGGSVYPKFRGKFPGKFYGKLYGKFRGKFRGKFYGNPTTHLGGKIQKIVRSRERCSKFEIGFLGSHISRCVVPYWKMDDLLFV